MKVELANIVGQHRALRDELHAAVDEVFESCRFILGDNVTRLERDVANGAGVKHGIGVNSGTDALLLALAAAGVKTGDEVITTPFTFVATAETICQLGATPVFADIDLSTFLIDPAAVESKITSKTKAILPVHLFGQIANSEALKAIATKYGLTSIGDGAQAIGAGRNGAPLGLHDQMTTLSFYPTKNLGGCGDGGMVVTDDDRLYEELKLLRFHGSGGGYIYKRIGYCSRLDELQAALLRVKLKRLDQWNESRRANAALYTRLLADLGDKIALPVIAEGNAHAFHQYTIRVLEGADVRDKLKQFLASREVGSAVFYPLSLHVQPGYHFLGYKEGDFPASETATRQVLSLPVHPDLTEDEVKFVAASIRDFFETYPGSSLATRPDGAPSHSVGPSATVG